MLKILILVLFIVTRIPISAQSNWERDYSVLLQEIVIDGKVDYVMAKSKNITINNLYETIHLNKSTLNQQVADLINAYNLIVIKAICDKYPIESVQAISGFFKKKHFIGDESFSLDEIENKLLSLKKDGRIHFALVCGAIDCPPLSNIAYNGKNLEDLLNQQTEKSLHLDNVFYVFEESKTLLVSKIFQWYQDDFGDLNKFWAKFNYIDYQGFRIKYATYDWSLNKAAKPNTNEKSISNSNMSKVVTTTPELEFRSSKIERYYASNLYTKGEYEVNIFNNYYSQTTPSGDHSRRENFFSTFVQGLWGLNQRINIGFDLKIRSVSSGPTNTIGLFDALHFRIEERFETEFSNISQSARFGFTQIGPKIKYQPVKNIPGLTLQHSLYIPLLLNGEGDQNSDYIDWGSPSFYTDIFFDHQLTQKISLFLQLGIYGENLGEAFLGIKDGYYQLATPITTIVNYFPTKKATIYFLVNSAPQFGFSRNNGEISTLPNHYNQYGLGYKYFISSKIQGELLFTKFSSVVQGRQAATYNLGFRYFGWR